MKVIDTIGTLELCDTGRRCSVRNFRILAVRCTKRCSSDENTLLHDGIVDAYWQTMKMVDGYHFGCDPNSEWRKDPVGTKLKHDAQRRLLGDPPGACVACGQVDCTGASS